MVRVGIVGAGIMGSNHARVLRAVPHAEVVVVTDPDADKGQRLADHIGASFESSLEALAGQVDAAIVATPTETHADIAATLMESGLDVLIEKPIAPTVEEAKDLVRHVDGLIHIDVRRVGSFTPRITTGVVLDLMIHDVDLVSSLAGGELTMLSSLTRRVRTESEDIATCVLSYASGVSATLTASRVSQAKQRQIELTQQANVVTADLLRQQVTIQRVEHAEYVGEQGARYRQSGVVEIPYLEHQGEPLFLEQQHFIDCVRNRTQPVVSGQEGLTALATALRIRDEAIRLG